MFTADWFGRSPIVDNTRLPAPTAFLPQGRHETTKNTRISSCESFDAGKDFIVLHYILVILVYRRGSAISTIVLRPAEMRHKKTAPTSR